MKKKEVDYSNLYWESLRSIFDKKLEPTEYDSENMKRVKNDIKKSYARSRCEACVLIACTIIFIVLALALTFAGDINPTVISIVFVLDVVMFIAVFAFAVVVSFRNKNKKEPSQKGMEDILRECKTTFWMESLDELADCNGVTKEATFMEILATTNVKSVFTRQIKLIEVFILVGEICFLPGIGSVIKEGLGTAGAFDSIFSLVFVLIANFFANFVGGIMEELTSINYKYSEMKRLVLEYYKTK